MIRLHKRGDRLWHTDSSFMELRSAQSLLLCHEAPPVGGETWFADSRSAYEDLPQAMKDRIEDLEARHSLWWSRSQAGLPRDEGRTLLRELIEFATQPQYVFNVAYQPGDMRRTTIREAPAPAEADDPFTELFRASGRTVFDRRPVS